LGNDDHWPLSGRPALKRREQFWIVVEGDEMAGILYGIAQLIASVGARLSTCLQPDCGAPVAIKRQAYCHITLSESAIRSGWQS
jgi:hypothetical protein